MPTRTNIVLDDELIAQAMLRAGVTTKKAAVEAALKAFVRKPDYSGLLALRGKGLIDPEYDPRGPYGLTQAALESRGLTTFAQARVAHERQTIYTNKAVPKPAKDVAVPSGTKRKKRELDAV